VVVLDVLGVLDVVVVLDVLGVLDEVVESTTVLEVLLVLGPVVSALLCSVLHALTVRARAPTARPARNRRDDMCSVCQPIGVANVQVSG
jgi:hypothetical protein